MLDKKFGPEKEQEPSAKQMQEIMETQLKLQPGVTFVDCTVAGSRRALRGQRRVAQRGRQAHLLVPPEGRKKYRVIYADLSVRDADAPPNVPHARAAADHVHPAIHAAARPGQPEEIVRRPRPLEACARTTCESK